MRSRAHIKTHPLHPILVSFPIAFFTGSAAFDTLAIALDRESFAVTGFYLLAAGLVMGLVAAVPGLVDFLYTVPPGSSARMRAFRHALLNLCMIALFAIAWFHRATAEVPAPGFYLACEFVGLGLMLVAGWLGGTLVHRNQIGVDHRYAFAGKWKEEYLEEEAGQVSLGTSDDLKRDQMKLIHVSGRRIVVGRTEAGIFAFDDRCTHKGGSLAGGMMICGTVQCPWHGSQFDVSSGAVKAGPAQSGIVTYKIENVNNTFYLRLRPEKA